MQGQKEAKEVLAELRVELKKKQEILSLDLENWNPASKPGMQGLQRNAKKEYPVILNQLGRQLLANSAVFFMTRNHKAAESNIKKAKSADNGIAIDYLQIEKDMADKLFQGQTSDFRIITDSVLGMNDFMYRLGKEIGAESMPSVDITGTDYGTFKTREDLINKLETILEKSYVGELKPLYIFGKLIRTMAERNDKDSYQILVYNAPENDTVLNRDIQLFANTTGVSAKVLKNKKEETK